MAYDKHTWTCDEPITVERLNHIEDGIAAGGDCDCGFECEERIVTLTEESVTTEQSGPFVWGSLSYSQLIDAETLKVTFNGTEYECPRSDSSAGAIYGGTNPTTMTPDFSQYPFAILSAEQIGNMLITETAGTYALKVQAVETTVTTTPCFDKARGYSCENVTLTEETLTATRVRAQ